MADENPENPHPTKKVCGSYEPLSFDWEPRVSYIDQRSNQQPQDVNVLVTHKGGCHCGDIRFEADASSSIVAWDCNCSSCAMKRNTHFVVSKKNFRVMGFEDPLECDKLSCYTYGSHTAKHLFCKRCGVVPFYQPRSNPDGFAITVHCLDPGTVKSIEVRCFDGTQWEDFIDGSGIQAFSTDTET